MRIKLLSDTTLSEQPYVAGQQLEIDEARARSLIEAGQAEPDESEFGVWVEVR